jgi:hypothetical protein
VAFGVLAVTGCSGSGSEKTTSEPAEAKAKGAFLPPGQERGTGINEVGAPPDSSRAACREILIRYAGSVGSGPEVTRTRAEARARAEEVLRKLREEGADFGEMVTEYSEGRSTDRDGYHAPFPRGNRPKAIEDAVFALRVGEISDVVESPAGMHVFLREEGTNYRAFLLLISYKGAGENDRSRPEAEALVNALYARIVAHPDSFPDIARQYTDGPRAQMGGNLGTFNRYTHGTEIGDAAKALTPGHLSRIFETKKGFGVMLRVQ